jgi:hypothetical protein
MGGQPLIMEMATPQENLTGLPVPIWIDEDEKYIDGGHGYRIKFKYKNGRINTRTNFIPMTIEDNPKVLFLPKDATIKAHEIELVKQWVIANKENLVLLSDKKIEYTSHFLKNMIRITKRGELNYPYFLKGTPYTKIGNYHKQLLLVKCGKNQFNVLDDNQQKFIFNECTNIETCQNYISKSFDSIKNN